MGINAWTVSLEHSYRCIYFIFRTWLLMHVSLKHGYRCMDCMFRIRVLMLALKLNFVFFNAAECRESLLQNGFSFFICLLKLFILKLFKGVYILNNKVFLPVSFLKFPVWTFLSKYYRNCNCFFSRQSLK